jgi:PTS system cellobiose-specific IIB component
VVCGAGASSTFVAQRINGAARTRNLPYVAAATNEISLAEDVESSDLILAGPHLAAHLPQIRALAAPHGVGVVLLDADAFSDLDGTRALALIEAAVQDGIAGTDPAPH